MKNNIKSSEIVYECPYFQVLKNEIVMPNGQVVTHYIHYRTLPFVVIVATQNDKILVSRQWRPVLQDWNWEFPMGGVDKNEPIIDAAKREFLEETGYACEECEEIGYFLVGSGHTNQKGIVCAGSNINKIKMQELEDSELIEVNWIKIADFEKMVKQGTIIDGPTLASWQIYKLKHKHKNSKHKGNSDPK